MPTSPARIVIAGISTRAFAESAVRAGYRCWSVDAFGDLDQRALVEGVAVGREAGRRWGAARAAALAGRFPAEAAAYTANFENHPRAVCRLARGRLLLGNGPEALALARDPFRLAEVARRAGAAAPRSLRATEAHEADSATAWLRKPVRGGGGSGVAPWESGRPLGRRELLQERLDGILASMTFLADGRRAVVLGASRQLAGDPTFGGRGFQYCGSLYPLPCAARNAAGERRNPTTPANPEDLMEGRLAGTAVAPERLDALANAATAAFGLVGINGMDFIVRDGVPYVLELNPRYVASAELVERAHGFSIFDAHVRACMGELSALPALPASTVFGKAVLYARRALVPRRPERWLERDDVRDIPVPGQRIAAGRPVCTLFARAADATACHARLAALAAELEADLDDPTP